MACSTVADCCLKFEGRMYVAKRQDCCPNFKKEDSQFIGNITQLDIESSLDKKSQKSYTGSGGNICSYTEITEVLLKLTFGCANNRVLENVMSGTVESLATTPVIDELHSVKPEDRVLLRYLPDTTVPYVVTDSTGTTTYVLGTDYNETAHGLEIIAGSSLDVDIQGATDQEYVILVDYTRIAQTSVKALTSTGKDYIVWVEGVNKLDGKLMNFVFPKVKFSPSATISLIGDDITTFEAEGELFDDPCGEYAKYELLRG